MKWSTVQNISQIVSISSFYSQIMISKIFINDLYYFWYSVIVRFNVSYKKISSEWEGIIPGFSHS